MIHKPQTQRTGVGSPVLGDPGCVGDGQQQVMSPEASGCPRPRQQTCPVILILIRQWPSCLPGDVEGLCSSATAPPPPAPSLHCIELRLIRLHAGTRGPKRAKELARDPGKEWCSTGLFPEQFGNPTEGLNEESSCLRKRYQISGGSGWPRQPLLPNRVGLLQHLGWGGGCSGPNSVGLLQPLG